MVEGTHPGRTEGVGQSHSGGETVGPDEVLSPGLHSIIPWSEGLKVSGSHTFPRPDPRWKHSSVPLVHPHTSVVAPSFVSTLCHNSLYARTRARCRIRDGNPGWVADTYTRGCKRKLLNCGPWTEDVTTSEPWRSRRPSYCGTWT